MSVNVSSNYIETICGQLEIRDSDGNMGSTNPPEEFAYIPDRPTEPLLSLFIVAMTTEDPRPYPSGGIFLSTSGSQFKVKPILFLFQPLSSHQSII